MASNTTAESTDAPSTGEPVSRPRDPVTGEFVSNRPRDAAVDAEIEQWAAGLPTSYPNTGPELRALSKHAYAMFRRLSRSAENGGALRPSGRVPKVITEAGSWFDRLCRITEAMEATNGKRKGRVDPAKAMADLHALVASRKG
jgi:hypothetical protein